MFNNAILTGLFRHVLTALGGFLVAKGYIGAEDVESLAGAAITIIGAVLSVRSKSKV